MTIEQEQKCAIEALSRASDVTQRLMFREGAKWMDAEHAAALARVRQLEAGLMKIRNRAGSINHTDDVIYDMTTDALKVTK